MEKVFLFVTANANETAALLQDKAFFNYQPDQRSSNPDDDTFYNIGYFGKYKVIHFELQSQGSVKVGAALTSIYFAIDSWNPDAVILVGIAFGRDESTQKIGDVLISTMMADYESGKAKSGQLLSDGPSSECGKTLLSVFKHYSPTWNHSIEGHAANCQFGILLSGDKVVDDSKFKAKLFKAYPRAIGGEMEGRGAYSACRAKRLDEWIIVKAICDWGEHKEDPKKEQNQITAAQSAVSLLKYIFSKEDAFKKLPKRTHTPPSKITKKSPTTPSVPLGYFISIGTTSCRLFEVRDKQTLVELNIISYDISDSQDSGYLDGIIKHVKYDILPKIEKKPSRLFPKVFVDYNFSEVFDQTADSSAKDDFMMQFYRETSLYFNLLTKSQTMENLKRLFGDIPNHTAIIDINFHNCDILYFSDAEFHMYSLPVTLSDVKAFVTKNDFPEAWTADIIKQIQTFISQRIGSALNGVEIDKAIIIKDELSFMQMMGYPLRQESGQLVLSQAQYKTSNRRYLFSTDYKSTLAKKGLDSATIDRLYNFKYGHILIETVLAHAKNKLLIPKNVHSIYGSGSDTYISYIFNVVLSGSTHKGRGIYMSQARDRLQAMGATVLSPHIDNDGKLGEITPETQHEHLKAIRECDMLFICNKDSDGYIGESTKCEIYFAHALYKPIAFWVEPPEDDRISFIPREAWNSIMSLED